MLQGKKRLTVSTTQLVAGDCVDDKLNAHGQSRAERDGLVGLPSGGVQRLNELIRQGLRFGVWRHSDRDLPFVG